MIRLPTFVGIAPYIIGGALLFIAGGELIGGYKVSKVLRDQERVQQQIVANAIEQAKDLAQKWEEENAKTRALKTKLDKLQGDMKRRNYALDTAATEREKEIRAAAEKLSMCLIDEDVRKVLNDWMIDETAPPSAS